MRHGFTGGTYVCVRCEKKVLYNANVRGPPFDGLCRDCASNNEVSEVPK